MKLTDKGKKAISIASVLLFIAFAVVILIFVGKPLIQFVENPDEFRAWVADKGFLGALAFVGMIVFQVVIAIVPGEPFEIGAGYAFGFWLGTLLTLIGILIGTVIIFLFVRFFGIKAVEVFFSREKINSLKFLQNHKKRDILLFLLMFIPGTPKDLLSYFVPLTDIGLGGWLLISMIARLPSVVTSTVGGSALGSQKYIFAIIVFGATLLVSAAGLIIYNVICKKIDKAEDGKGKDK